MQPSPEAPSRQIDLELVTFHAVTRYVQRVRNMVVRRPDSEQWDSRREACEHCAAIGLTVLEVRRLIMSPLVLAAIDNHLSRVRTNQFVAILDADRGTVKSIYAPEWQTAFSRNRLKVKTRREAHREAQTRQRMNRRRPK